MFYPLINECVINKPEFAKGLRNKKNVYAFAQAEYRVK